MVDDLSFCRLGLPTTLLDLLVELHTTLASISGNLAESRRAHVFLVRIAGTDAGRDALWSHWLAFVVDSNKVVITAVELS